MRALLRTLTVTLLVAGPAAAQNVNPAGVWDWQVNFQGQVLAGSFDIRGDQDRWTGTATSDMGTVDITAIDVDGNVVTLAIDTGGQGEVFIEMVIEGDEFTGTGTFGYDTFQMTGRKRKA